MRIEERLDKIEAAWVRHLEESGTIRTDLVWLKKAFWTLAAAVVVAVVSQILRPGVSNVYLSSVPQVQQKP